MTRPTIGPRVQRMLSLIPWIRSHPEGVPIDEVCARFAIDRGRLLADLSALGRSVSDDYLPGDVIDVVVDDGRIFVYMPLSFTRPLRLTTFQALALVASGSALAAAFGGGLAEAAPLRSALAKVARSLDLDLDQQVAVDLGSADVRHIDAIRAAVADRRQVRIGYYSAGRDDHSERVVDPRQLVSMDGHWYLSGWCHTANGDRLFRVDRIDALDVLDNSADPHPEVEPLGAVHFDRSTPRVTLRVAPELYWWAETVPVDGVEIDADGWARVTLPVSSPTWLQRVLLQHGPGLHVVADPEGLATGVGAVARRMLDRYRPLSPPLSEDPPSEDPPS